MWRSLLGIAVIGACSGPSDDDDKDPSDIVGDGDADTDTDTDSDTDSDTDVPPAGRCDPLPAATGTTVALTEYLEAAIAAATAGDTLLLADGVHNVVGPIVVDKALTIRGVSDDRELAIVDGGETGGNLFQVTASGVTFAHVTLRNSFDDVVKIAPSADISGFTMHDVHVIDAGRWGLSVADDDGPWADDGTVSCSRFELTNTQRPFVRNGCDTGGIDARGTRGWTVRDNVFSSYWCAGSLANPTIRFWRGSRDTLVTRNQVLDTPYGIVMGETQDAAGRQHPDVTDCEPGALQSIDGTVTNNIVSAYDDDLLLSAGGLVVGISAESSCDVTVVHNSVQAGSPPSAGSIEVRYETTTGTVENNLMSFDLIVVDADVDAQIGSNIENAPENTWFFAAGDDFHTAPASAAVDEGIPSSVTDDVDGEPRDDGFPDIGADEI
jgi:hypothetical protein